MLTSSTSVQAVHDEVPPDALSPLLRQLVDQFVHDRARPEVMSLGLKTVRSLCERAPLVMTPELLQVRGIIETTFVGNERIAATPNFDHGELLWSS